MDGLKAAGATMALGTILLALIFAVAFRSPVYAGTGCPGQVVGVSWYGPGFHGKKTASGERFNQNAMTAAHKSLPFGTKVKVVDQRTGRTVTVRITDRGPYVKGRSLDLSRGAAEQIGLIGPGHGRVCMVVLP